MARHAIETFEGSDQVVVNAAGCGSGIPPDGAAEPVRLLSYRRVDHSGQGGLLLSAAAAPRPAAQGRSGRETAAVVGLVLVVAALAIVAITFRDLWYLSLPLGLVGLISAAWSIRGGSLRISYWSIAVVALLLGLLALLVSAAALAASIDISRGYDVYER